MQKQLLIGCNGRRALHTTEPPVEEQFRLVRESGAFDYFDRLPPRRGCSCKQKRTQSSPNPQTRDVMPIDPLRNGTTRPRERRGRHYQRREHVMNIGTGVIAAFALLLNSATAMAQSPPVRVGEISSYSALPQGTEGYKKGWQLALEQTNAAGGVIGGRKLEVIFRDDAGKPEAAARAAQELLTNEKVDLLAGTILSNIGVAVADFAGQNKTFFLASQALTDAIIWEKGNRYTFRLRPSTYTHALILADEIAKNPAKRWATIAPNFEYGQSAVASFKEILKAKRPDVEFIAEQWPALGKLDAGSTVQALLAGRRTPS
jgi:branched-chain amino acid transport system substrate-binding protein